MKTRTRILGLVLVLLLVVSSFAGCGTTSPTPSASNSESPSASATPEPTPAAPAKDTVTALLPPVSPNYQKNFEQMQNDFNALYPNLTLKIEPAGWEDMTSKLDVQVNAGSPPDIAFRPAGEIPKYIDSGLILDLSKIATSEMIADFDEGALAYMKNGDGIYGFPAYMSIHSIGGNKQFLEEAGIDWKTVQKNGWTYEEFREAIKKGVVKNGDQYSRYGFIFACAGVASKDYLGILAKNAGMPNAFTNDLKFAYTSKNYLELLKAIRTLIDDGSMPKELSSVDAGKRWNMFLTGQTMITGKGLTVFENSAKTNNKKIDLNDGSAVKDSIKVEYIVLPVPTFFGSPERNMCSVDGYVAFRGKAEPTKEHMDNIAKAAYFLASGKVAAETNNDLFLPHISKSAKEAAKSITTSILPENAAAAVRLTANAAPARHDIPTELAAKAIKIEDEVIVPKLQALLANEITPQEMYDAVRERAIQDFGEDGIVKD